MNLDDQHQCFDRWMADHIAILYRVVNGFAEGADRNDLMQEVMLALLTGFISWLIFGTDKVKLTAEWAVIPLLLIPWVFAGLFLRQFLRQPPTDSRTEMTVSDSLRAAWAANQAERFKLKIVGLMYLIALPVLACCIWQLHSVGKVSSRELISMVMFLGGALALTGCRNNLRY